MKKVVVLAVLVAAGLLAYNFATRGKLTLIPSGALSADDQAIESFDERLQVAAKMYSQAGRTSGLSGADMTADAETAREEVADIEKGLKELKKTTASQEAKQKIGQLLNKADGLKRQMGG